MYSSFFIHACQKFRTVRPRWLSRGKKRFFHFFFQPTIRPTSAKAVLWPGIASPVLTTALITLIMLALSQPARRYFWTSHVACIQSRQALPVRTINASNDCLAVGKAALQAVGYKDLSSNPCRAFQVPEQINFEKVEML